jgi:phage-related protein
MLISKNFFLIGLFALPSVIDAAPPEFTQFFRKYLNLRLEKNSNSQINIDYLKSFSNFKSPGEHYPKDIEFKNIFYADPLEKMLFLEGVQNLDKLSDLFGFHFHCLKTLKKFDLKTLSSLNEWQKKEKENFVMVAAPSAEETAKLRSLHAFLVAFLNEKEAKTRKKRFDDFESGSKNLLEKAIRKIDPTVTNIYTFLDTDLRTPFYLSWIYSNAHYIEKPYQKKNQQQQPENETVSFSSPKIAFTLTEEFVTNTRYRYTQSYKEDSSRGMTLNLIGSETSFCTDLKPLPSFSEKPENEIQRQIDKPQSGSGMTLTQEKADDQTLKPSSKKADDETQRQIDKPQSGIEMILMQDMLADSVSPKSPQKKSSGKGESSKEKAEN